MIAATGAKNGAVAPEPTSPPPRRARPRRRPGPSSASPPARAPSASPSRRASAPRRPRQPLGDHSAAPVLDQVQPQQRLGERAARQLPALALIERARPGGAVRRVEPDRLVALARGLLERRAGAGAPPGRCPTTAGARTASTGARGPGCARAGARARSAWVMPTCPAGSPSGSSAIAHQVVSARSRSRIERISRLCGGGCQPSGAHSR